MNCDMSNVASTEFAARPDQVSRMYYQNFGDHITEKYGIIIENWPL